MELNRHTHPHVLRSLARSSIPGSEHIPVLQCLESEVVEHEVTIVIDKGLQLRVACVLKLLIRNQPIVMKKPHTLEKCLGRVLVVVINHNARCQLAVVRVMACLHHRTCLRSKQIEFRRLDTVRDLTTNLLGNKVGVDILQSMGKSLDPFEDLIKGNRFTNSIALCDVNMVRHARYLFHCAYL